MHVDSTDSCGYHCHDSYDLHPDCKRKIASSSLWMILNERRHGNCFVGYIQLILENGNLTWTKSGSGHQSTW